MDVVYTCAQVYYVLSSVWLHQFYYLFGFLFLVLVILFLTCAEVTMVMCYFHNTKLNHYTTLN
jgi:hypothetical protein